LVDTVTVTVILGRSCRGNERRRVIGDTLQFPGTVGLIEFIRRIGFVELIHILELTTFGIVGIDEALEGAGWGFRSVLLRGHLLGRLDRHGLLRLGGHRLHMGKGRGSNGWTHLTLDRVVVITLQSTLELVAVFVT